MPIYIILLPLAVLPVFCLSAWVVPAALCLWSAVFLYTFRNAADHWPCFRGFTWGIFEGWFFVFLPLWRLTVYNHTLDIKWKAWNLNLLLPPFRLFTQKSHVSTEETKAVNSWRTIINSVCVVSSWFGLCFGVFLVETNVSIQCFPQAVPSFLEILDPKGTLHRTQRLICSC